MSIQRWSPFHDMEELMNRLPSLTRMQSFHDSFVPAIDIYEKDNAVVVEAPLAGVNPEDVSVSVESGSLTIKGESKHEHEVDDKNYYRKEVRSGSFHRTIALPIGVDESKVTAEFNDGVLTVTAPKVAETDVKKVDIKVIKKSDK